MKGIVKMEADFRGYVTKAGLKCSDGRTIMPDAFKHQDQMQVPLVWQHGHDNPENVLGHIKLENRPDGVYGYGFFNKTARAQHTQQALEHGDFNAMSIWANQLIERSKSVMHGAIREVSLVLAGANPGAIIDHVTIRHSDDTETTLDDEAVITFTGLSIEHSDLSHAGEDGNDDEETVQDVYDSMTEKQKQVLHYMIGEALAADKGDAAEHSDIELDDDATVADIYASMSDAQRDVLHYMVGEALESSADSAKHDNLDDSQKGNNEMKHNVFEKDSSSNINTPVLSHSDVEGIVASGMKLGSLKEAVEEYALSHGIEDIDTLFPDAQAIDNTPELFGRRVEWVGKLLAGVRKSPFSRVKTMSADLTVAEARAKGYIKGTMKKEEFFRVSKRITTPTTIYKKQKLDRDDIVDITDFDVVVWLKREMRLMLDEEIARAILVGDGRAADDEDKVDEERIRPIANDHELYTTTVYVNVDDANSNMNEVYDAITMNRSKLRGTGLPTMFTTETYIARTLVQRDTLGRKIYTSLDQLATELRVADIVAVEILEEYDDIVAILVNPVDYNVGATAGGQVSMFDDFDIDYNQYKYLIETRMSGALIKLKSAMVVRKTAGNAVLVTPTPPTFEDNEITIPTVTGVVYRNADTDAVMNAAGSPYAVADGVTITVSAEPASSSYYFASSDDDLWAFTGEE